MHSGSNNDRQENVWPGYVAAMSSLLLSLLLVTAVLVITVGQVGNLSDRYINQINKFGLSSSSEVDAKVGDLGITDADIETLIQSNLANLDTMNVDSEKRSGFRVANSQGMKIRSDVIDFENESFDKDAALQTSRLLKSDRELLVSIDLSSVDFKKIRFAKYDYRKVNLALPLTAEVLGKVDFSEVDWGRLSQERIDRLKPLIAKEAIRRKVIVDTKNILFEKNSRPSISLEERKPFDIQIAENNTKLKESSEPRNRKLSLIFADESLDLAARDRDLLRTYLEDSTRYGRRVLIFTEIESANEPLYRAAFARLMLVRKLAIDFGFPASRLDIRIGKKATSAVLSQSVVVEITTPE